MSNFEYLTADKAYNSIYLQFPKAFLTSPIYRELSDSAKIAYMVLKDRAEYSLRKGLVDSQHRVYFLFTDKELANILNKSKPTALKIKKELINFNLLRKVDMGFNKLEMKRNASRLYIADLNVSASDVYFTQNVDMTHSKESLPSLESHGKNSLSSELSQKTAQNVGRLQGKDSLPSFESHGKNSLLELYNINKDNKDNKDQSATYRNQANLLSSGVSDAKIDPHIESDLINHYLEDNALEDLYGKELTESIKKFSMNNFERLKLFHEKLYYANKGAEKELGYTISVYKDSSPKYHFYQEELNRTFWKCIQSEKNGKISDLNSYLFSSFKNTFLFIGKDINVNTKVLPSISNHDWSSEN